MKKLIKKRMRSYLHPAGTHVRAYELEGPTTVSASADNTRATSPTPPPKGMMPNDDAHNKALFAIGMAAAITGFSKVLEPEKALRDAGAAAAGTAGVACGYCHK